MRYLYLRQDLETARSDINAYLNAMSQNSARTLLQRAGGNRNAPLPSGLMVFDGRLAAVTIEPIRPEIDSDTLKVVEQAPIDYSVFMTFIDAAQAEKIGVASGLADPALHVVDVAQPPADGRVGLDLKNPAGKIIARIDWVDAKPGSAAFASRFVPIGLMLLIVGTLTLMVTYNLSARQVRLSDQARRAAEDASFQKSFFLANVSHELRTPLNAIIGYSEILTEDALEAQNKVGASDARKVTRAAHHLLALINDLLDHSKIEAGKMDLTPSQTKIEPILHDVVEALNARAKEHGNQITLACDPIIGEAMLDPMRLKQCLLNLMSNAVKFTHYGTITLSARPVDIDGVPNLRFTIKDTGIGMSAETVDKLFVPFVQANELTAQKFGGTGLGLVITRRLIEAMGGQVSVDSNEGKGSTFTLIVPRGMAWQSQQLPSQETNAMAA